MHEGERTVHPGNVADIVEQVRYYFQQQPGDLLGVNSAYIRDIDERMRALASQEFTGLEDDASSDSLSETSGAPGGAAGADSDSDSDGAP